MTEMLGVDRSYLSEIESRQEGSSLRVKYCLSTSQAAAQLKKWLLKQEIGSKGSGNCKGQILRKCVYPSGRISIEKQLLP